MAVLPYPTPISLPTMTLRHVVMPDDLGAMNGVANAVRRADGEEWVTSDAQFRAFYENLSNCDPATDVMVVERDGRVVGYGRASWYQDLEGQRLYEPVAFAHLDQPPKLLEAVMEAMEVRCREIAATHPAGPKQFQTNAFDSAVARVAVLLGRGYEPVRYSFFMVRSDLDDLPDATLPANLEAVQPVGSVTGHASTRARRLARTATCRSAVGCISPVRRDVGLVGLAEAATPDELAVTGDEVALTLDEARTASRADARPGHARRRQRDARRASSAVGLVHREGDRIPGDAGDGAVKGKIAVGQGVEAVGLDATGGDGTAVRRIGVRQHPRSATTAIVQRDYGQGCHSHAADTGYECLRPAEASSGRCGSFCVVHDSSLSPLADAGESRKG